VTSTFGKKREKNKENHLIPPIQWMGLREHLQENPITLTGKSMVSGSDFPLFSLKPSHSRH